MFIIAGSDRRQYNCPGVDSKARTLMLRMADRLPQQWEIDYEDLGNVYGRARIQSCNACVSTSMALCVWPCNCYEKNNKKEPDLMWDLDMYARLDLADAWAIIGPVNWYAPTSNLKLMFDRLVCMNGGNPCDATIKHKDPELAMKLERSSEWQAMSLNHLEGRTAAFLCYGDGGGNELDETGRPKLLNDAHKHYFNPEQEPFENERDSYAPLVWNAGMVGWKFPMRCGNTWNLEKMKCTATIRQKICRVTNRSFHNWTPGPTGSPASSRRKGKWNRTDIAHLATTRLATSFLMSGSRGGTFACASEVRAYILHQRSNNGWT